MSIIPKTRKEAFKVLGLSESASTEKIKKAYHKLALQWHPDKWSGKSQEEQKTATEKFKEISVAYKISIGEITEEFVSQQPNDDWINNVAEYCKNWAKELLRERYGSHLSEEEVDLFKALDDKDLAKTKILLEKVKNINSQTRMFDLWTGKSILHYIVQNSCSNFESGWIELLEEVLSKYSANNSISAHNSSVEPCSQLNAIDVNILMEVMGTPLHIACNLGNLDVISMLLKHGADPNTCSVSQYTPLYHALQNRQDDVVKVLFEHGAEIGVGIEENLIINDIIKYSQSTVEMLLLYASNRQKSKMLQFIAYRDSVETDNDNDIEIAKLLLKAGADPKFCGQEKKGESNASASFWANFKKKSKLVKLFNEHKEKATNNNLHTVEKQSAQPPITDNKNHHSPQKQASGISPRVIGLALLFGAVGATLVAIGIIPEIIAIGVIATAVLLGIAGAALGGIVGYLTDITVNKCHSKAVMKVA
ncbi:ankyrin repeat domain-containing protein [Wolbachia endosymbiont of Zygogramma bicolorata]|uniref:ankyrin repeat domain-containing protein n=1 Tax=Wolbachia endosymbiont of Zygogramma bicolorata TaxID=3134048 RepID=UPI003DA8DBF8